VRKATHLGATTPAGGIALRVTKGLPLSAGQGGSAASAVAGAAAVNALIGSPLSREELLEAALFAETQVAGRHLDNVAPSYLGGIILIRSLDPIDIIPLPVPSALHLVLATPAQSLRTAEARAVLPVEVSLNVACTGGAGKNVAHCTPNLALLGRWQPHRRTSACCCRDCEGNMPPSRGGAGVSISGAGPTAFALCSAEATAGRWRRRCATHTRRPALTAQRVWRDPTSPAHASRRRCGHDRTAC
jgi:homoserine kinase